MKRGRKIKRKRDSYDWLRKIYRFLRSKRCQSVIKNPIIFEKEEVFGLTIFRERKNKIEIQIDPKKGNFFITLIHECLHATGGFLSEYKVETLTRKIIKEMTAIQYVHLLINFSRALRNCYRYSPRK